MTLSRNQFLSLLDESGIFSAKDVIALQETQDDSSETALDLAKTLVKNKKLNEFQIKMILQHKGDRLVLGDYLILREIGAGGMGKVYLAEHRRMKRKVALKTLPTKIALDEESIGRFQREVQAAAKLSHPNIVTAYDAGEAKGVSYFVMEYVDGINLSDLIKEHGVLQVDVAVNYIIQAAKGLGFAHSEGIIHRDIKPANLLLDLKGTVKILDMGLARIDNLEPSEVPVTQLTESGSVKGTLDYMAPEQAQNTHAADARSDIYSLGCSLYYLLTSRVMYPADSFVKKILAHLEQPIPSIQKQRPEVPDELEAIFQKMVSKEPVERYNSTAELIEALESIPFDQSSQTDQPQQEPIQIQPGPRKIVLDEDLSTLFSLYKDDECFSEYGRICLDSTVMQPKARYPFMRWLLPLGFLALLWWAFSNQHLFFSPLKNPAKTATGAPEKAVSNPADKKSTSPVNPADNDRAAASRALELGGVVEISVDEEPQVIEQLSELPAGNFQTKKILLHENKQVLDEDLKWFCYLKNLETLDLYDTNITDVGIAHLKALPALSKIDLYNTKTGDAGLEQLSQFGTLRSITMQHTAVTNEGLKYLSGLSSLDSLNLGNTGINDSGLAHLKSLAGLQWLQLSFTNVTDSGLLYLQDLKSLRELYLTETQVTDDGKNLLMEALPECSIMQ